MNELIKTHIYIHRSPLQLMKLIPEISSIMLSFNFDSKSSYSLNDKHMNSGF